MVRRITYASVIAFCVFMVFSMQAQGNRSVQGEGAVVKQDLSLAAITGIDLLIAGHVTLTQGSAQKVTVEAQQNIIDLLKRDVKDGVWHIGFDNNVNNYKSVNIYITLPSLEDVGLSGSGSITSTNKFNKINDLDLYLTGSGNISLDIEAKSTEVELAGSGQINLKGLSTELDIEIAGSGNVHAEELKADNCEVEISGSGDASVHVDKKLTSRIAGSGDVEYSGSASVNSSIVGSGNVKKVN